jgi:hypothetical protein
VPLVYGTEFNIGGKLYKIIFGVIFSSNLFDEFKGGKNEGFENIVGKSGE